MSQRDMSMSKRNIHVYIPKKHVYVPERRVHVPDGHVYVPEKHVYVPEKHVYVPEKHIYVPETHVYVPETHVYVPEEHGGPTAQGWVFLWGGDRPPNWGPPSEQGGRGGTAVPTRGDRRVNGEARPFLSRPKPPMVGCRKF